MNVLEKKWTTPDFVEKAADQSIIQRKYQSVDDYMPIKNSLRVLYINARSIRNKIDEIEETLKRIPDTVHVLVVTETWLGDGEGSLFNINGYQGTFASRTTGRGGGVAIYTHNTFNCEVIEKWSTDNSFLGVRVQYKHFKPLNIYVIYRKPNNNVNDFLVSLESILQKSSLDTFIFGDFNINILKKNYTIKNISTLYFHIIISYVIIHIPQELRKPAVLF